MSGLAELQERVERIEAEVENLKKQVSQLTYSGPPREALALLEALWGLKDAPASSLSLQEARERLAQGLKPNWASRQIIKSRNPAR